MLEAEWGQGSVGAGANEDEPSTGRIWAAGFHHDTARFETYKPFIFFIFIFFSPQAVAKPHILNQWIWVHDCTLFIMCCSDLYCMWCRVLSRMRCVL
jgi:hypothetical protein